MLAEPGSPNGHESTLAVLERRSLSSFARAPRFPCTNRDRGLPLRSCFSPSQSASAEAVSVATTGSALPER